MAKRDYYEVLGVARDAGGEDIKKAFRKLAMQYHPDRNSGDKSAEHRFKEINEAYEVLKDEQKRAAYDRFGHAAFEHGSAGGARAGGFEAHFGAGFADIFDEMFGDFMGGGRRGAEAATRGSDLRYNMEITLEEAFLGKKTTIRVPTSVGCESCSGTGAEAGARPIACATCHGRGRVRASQGFFTVERTCPTCHGAGQIIEKPCKSCQGTGRTRKEKTLAVNIPAGVDDGTRIRLAGEGEAGLRAAPPGDLYIFLSIAPHRFFQRDGANIFCRVPIPLTRAALGGTIEVPTVDGTRARVNVPAGTQSGAQFRLREKGMTVLRAKGRGDMYIEVAVETPVNLTKKQKELLEQFEKAGTSKSTSPESEGFFAKVKDLWEDLKD
jgi:molecular chaperone DnaJ